MDTLIKLSQACEIMHVSYPTGYKMARAGELPFRRLGGSWVIPRSVLYRELGLEQPTDNEDVTYA